MSDLRPVGVFDSGFGGISVMADLMRLMPHERFLYLGDDAHAPYGDGRSVEELRALALARAQDLKRLGAKAIVIACNTATAAAVKLIRERLPLPIIGMEPALKPALALRGTGRVAVLATPSTLAQEKFHTLSHLAPPDTLLEIPCPGLAMEVQKGDWNSAEMQRLLDRLLAPCAGQRLDAAVLGCTHYTFLRSEFSRRLNVPLCDGNVGTAQQLRRVLAGKLALAPTGRQGALRIETTGRPAAYAWAVNWLEKQGVERARINLARETFLSE